VTDETMRRVELAHRYADLEDVRLHYVEAGDGPLVLLLHGFPIPHRGDVLVEERGG
jgi:pimeloyl-ACP methyl ester carboxylesterase